MMRKTLFEGYNVGIDPKEPGARNKPTWTIQTWISDQNLVLSRETIEDLLGRFVKGYHSYPYIKGIVSDWLLDAVNRVDWFWIQNELKYIQNEVSDVDELTMLTYQTLLTADWQMVIDRENLVQDGGDPFTKVVKGIESALQIDDRLMEWVRGMIVTWYENPRARKADTPSSRLALHYYRIYLEAVQWDKVEKFLKGE